MKTYDIEVERICRHYTTIRGVKADTKEEAEADALDLADAQDAHCWSALWDEDSTVYSTKEVA